MEPLTIILYIVAVLLLAGAIFKKGVSKDWHRLAIGVVGVLLVVFNLGVIDFDTQTITGGDGDGDTDASSGKAQPIVTFNAWFSEDFSNSPTAITDGVLDIYNKDDNPSKANVDPVVSITVPSSGKFTSSSPGLSTNTEYRIVYRGNGSWYSHDFDKITFNSVDGTFDDDTNQYDWRPEVKLQKQASITDFFDETSVAGIMNGHTNTSITLGTNEIGCATDCSSDGVLVYDESQGDGSVYLDLTHATGSSNAVIQDYSVCILYEDGAEPEDNEFSSITLSSQSGEGIGLTAANGGSNDITDIFANEACLVVGDVKSGTTHKWRYTFTYDEANLATDDDFKIVADDLGDINGKTVDLDTGVTKETLDFDAQA